MASDTPASDAPEAAPAAAPVEPPTGSSALAPSAEASKADADRERGLEHLLKALRGASDREPEDAATAEQRAAPASYSPTDDELDKLTHYVLKIRTDFSNPQLLARLKSMRTYWSVSEKRVRKAAQRVREAEAKDGGGEEAEASMLAEITGQPKMPKPVSKNDKLFSANLKKVAPKLEMRRHAERGRGLFVREAAEANELLFQEDAYVYSPNNQWLKAVYEGQCCAHCGKPLGRRPVDALMCTYHPKAGASSMPASRPLTAKQKAAKEARDAAAANAPVCILRFCSTTCKSASERTYGKLVCPHANPPYYELLEWSEKHPAPQQVFRIWARLITTARRSEAEAKAELALLETLCTVSERERKRTNLEQAEPIWRDVHEMVLAAMHIAPAKPRPPPAADAPAAIEGAPAEETPAPNGDNAVALVDVDPLDDPLYTGPPPAWLSEALGGFSLDSFLQWWGRCALNFEEDGGLFIAHSSLNHSCNPSGRLDRSAGPRGSANGDLKPSRIFLKAGRKMAKGEELTVHYIPLQHPLQARQSHLATEYHFACLCDRCESDMRSGNSPLQISSVGPDGKIQTMPWGIGDDPEAFLNMLRSARERSQPDAEARSQITAVETEDEPSGVSEIEPKDEIDTPS